ncbi:MAG: hypothetical protein M1372_03130 [Patescibacteria group bacterium]|nr:hypothetical protein [Patescibacteria group bacterium]
MQEIQGYNTSDYQKLLTEVIKKQMVILGPDITLAKARNVKGLKIDQDGTVLEISGPPQDLIQDLINQFVELSGLIVQKTMEPLLANLPQGAGSEKIPQGVGPTSQTQESSQVQKDNNSTTGNNL